MTLPAALARTIEWWNGYHGAHQLVSVGIRYLHLAGLVVGGGTALAVDRQALGAVRGTTSDRQAALSALQRSHRVVVPSLVVVAATGALMTAADLSTFLASRLYWIKMGLVLLLVVNGALLVAAESAASRGRPSGWTRLGVASALSVILWLVILFAGAWLTVAA
jgi:hypothetical protein